MKPKTYQIKKPKGTFYSDWVISKGKLIAIFEHGDRVTTKKVCKANEKTEVTDISETKDFYIITT